MANKGIDVDLEPIVAEARLLSIEWKHGFINYDHLFVALLKNKCDATVFCVDFDLTIWEKKVKDFYPVDGSQTMGGSVFLTKTAERVFKHAFIIAKVTQQKKITSVHLLLAILSFDNKITQAFNAAGILIEDITTARFKKEVKRFPPILSPLKESNYNRLELFFYSIDKKKKRSTELLNNASDLYFYGQFNDSIKACLVGLSLAPEDVELKSVLAFNYIKLRNYAAALSMLLSLIDEDPGNVRFRYSASYIFDKIGQSEEAARLLDHLLLEQPDNPVFLNNSGFNLLRQQRYRESIPFFEKAIQQDPLFGYPYNNLGFGKYKLGEIVAGIALIDKSLDLDKGNSFAYKHKGITAMEQGNNADAKRYFNLALKYGYSDKYDNEVEVLLTKLES